MHSYSKVLLHDHNEYLNEQVFLDGIVWYERIILKLASVSKIEEQGAGKLLVKA